MCRRFDPGSAHQINPVSNPETGFLLAPIPVVIVVVMSHDTCTIPVKPSPTFPLYPGANGQWAKKVKGRRYYFGSWKTDPFGTAALKDWLARKDAIAAGLDNLRVSDTRQGRTLSDLFNAYMAQRKTDLDAGELAPPTYKDYIYELQGFVSLVGATAQVSDLKPEHFAAYHDTLINDRKLGRHRRRTVLAYIKAMLNWGAGQGWYPAPTYGNGFTAPDTSPDAMRQAKARAGEKDFSKLIVTGAQVATLLARASVNYRAIILMGINCGLGPADLGRLTWGHVNMDTGELDMPRGKTGTERRGYLWKRTRKALLASRNLKHTKADWAANGNAALVFRTRKNRPLYQEVKGETTFKIDQTVSGSFSKLAKGMEGVTFYRLRHTFKTLGKKARDPDALNLMMGHRERTTGETYDHEHVDLARLRRVALAVKRGLWPKASVGSSPPPARGAGGGHVAR